MDAPVVEIDVARDRLDIHVHPSGANFAVDRTTEGVEQLCERLRPLKPKLVALIATAWKLITILNAILRDGTPWQPA
jgi:transposase